MVYVFVRKDIQEIVVRKKVGENVRKTYLKPVNWQGNPISNNFPSSWKLRYSGFSPKDALTCFFVGSMVCKSMLEQNLCF